MERWQISAIIGTIIFLIAGFLPVISVFIFGFSLFDLYGALFGAGLPVGMPVSMSWILITLILYPITVILGFVSIIKHKLTIVAGILGIICWIGAILFISEISAIAGGLLGYGYGIYVGFIGAIILLVTYFIKPKAST